MEDFFNKAKSAYGRAIKSLSKTDTEKKLSEALSKRKLGASSTLLREIAGLTHDWQEYSVVMREMWASFGP